MRASTRSAVASVIAAVLSLSSAPVAAEPTASLVADIHASAGSAPRSLTVVGTTVFFTADDGSRGRELWVTDGSSAGTRLVRDIRPGASGSAPKALTRVGTRLFFSADDGSHGRELWVSDGTRAGTRLVRDLTPGSKGSGGIRVADLAGTALFSRRYEDLWRTAGSASTTRLVKRFKAIDLLGSVAHRGRLFFAADGALWRTDGSVAGTDRVSARWLDVGGLTRYRGHVYFLGALHTAGAASGDPGVPHLWRSDGTRAGTKRFGDILIPTDMTVRGGVLYFNGRQSGSGVRLCRSDGTRAGTGPLVPRVRPLPGMVKRAGRLWMTRVSEPLPWNDELWVSDATSAGTKKVKGGTADWFTAEDGLTGASLDGRLWFVAGPGQRVGGDWTLTDHELWVSDGTSAGTVEAVDVDPSGSSHPRDLVKLGGALLFSADDGVHGRELWRVEP